MYRCYTQNKLGIFIWTRNRPLASETEIWCDDAFISYNLDYKVVNMYVNNCKYTTHMYIYIRMVIMLIN